MHLDFSIRSCFQKFIRKSKDPGSEGPAFQFGPPRRGDYLCQQCLGFSPPWCDMTDYYCSL